MLNEGATATAVAPSQPRNIVSAANLLLLAGLPLAAFGLWTIVVGAVLPSARRRTELPLVGQVEGGELLAYSALMLVLAIGLFVVASSALQGRRIGYWAAVAASLGLTVAAINATAYSLTDDTIAFGMKFVSVVVMVSAALAFGLLLTPAVRRYVAGCDAAGAPGGPPAHRDARVLRGSVQFFVVLVVVLAGQYLWNNFVANTDEVNIDRSFDFLNQPTGFRIQGSSFEPSGAIRRAIGVGLKNTLASVIVGVPMSLVLGTLIGIARLSKNFLLAKFAAFYVEALRNTPVLVIIFFVNSAVILQFPTIQEAYEAYGVAVISNFRLGFPSIASHDGSGMYITILLAAAIVAVLVARWRTRVFETTGTDHHRVLFGLGTFLLIAAVGYVALGGPYSISLPRLDGRRVNGGITTLGPYVALTLALTLYTASHIAEIVRGSILAVAKGQTEAAQAVALTSFQRYRYIILPQAFRIAVPPIINQFLNYTKNTSLALAVGYAEITTVVITAIGNGQPAPQSIMILMASYLVFSLTISVILNIVNRRLQIVGR